MATGLILSLVALVKDGAMVKTWIGRANTEPAQSCQAIVHSDASVSREQLAQLLAIPERQAKAAVQKVLAKPYCRLPPLQLRANVVAERESYPLAFDPTTHLVILYENDEYAGYRFRFQ
ncbi:MAG: hypothetical protein VKL98_09425 [Cyanobacteriota bacterium]|nr:hypothetical protein [Cyanobacteriota bacterium]